MGSELLKTFPESFVTERLLLRAAGPEDASEANTAVVESRAELAPWMSWAAQELELDAVRENFVRTRARFMLREEMRFHLFLRDDPGSFVGSCGLHRIDWSVPRLEIGYWLRTSFTGQGYATEAVRGITDYAFRELDAERLEIWCDARNERSAAVARRAGFTQEALMRHNERDAAGELSDSLGFALLREEWEAS
ncbi:MAG TPA: GNAT family protein [Candidatus Limnocylindria bacterium]|jgi:RimJ/RimL family protein N-acetyltransferase|nr:GNAT family protein [Candidatus Limnocylindria bacterium]